MTREEFENLPGIMFHGTKRRFTTFRATVAKDQQLGFGIHFTPDREFAALYGPIIIAAKLLINKLFDMDTLIRVGTPEFAMAQELYRGNRRVALYVDRGLTSIDFDVTSPSRAQRVLQAWGYDAVRYEAKYGTRSPYGPVWSRKAASFVVFGDDQIITYEKAVRLGMA